MATKARVSAGELKAMLAEATQRHRAGDIGTAEVLYRNILAVQPRHFDALNMLAVIGYQTNQIKDSVELFRQAEALQPNHLGMLVNYGAALKKLSKLEDAMALYDRALSQQPDYYQALYNKAQCLLELGRFEEAVDFYRRSLALNPKDAEGQVALGNALQALGHWDAAFESYEAALSIDPKCMLALIAMALAYRQRDWFASALEVLERAVQIDPKNPTARSHYSLMLLISGQLKAGWESYEGRFWYSESQILRRPIPPAYWGGEDLKGKTIVVWPEQGVGDEIVYASMLPALVEQGANVIFECNRRMVPIFERSFPQMKVLSGSRSGEATNADYKADYQVAVGSLGRFLRPDFESFSAQNGGYLRADTARVQSFKERYGTSPLIGVSWKSSAGMWGGKKSSALSDWSSILKSPATFVSLQYGDVSTDLKAVKERDNIDVLVDATFDQLKDMDSFFAQVAAMDLVITTSNTTAHVAASQGIPTWVLLPKGTGVHWYWFRGRTRTPWYPSVSLYRQSKAGDWSPVFEQIAADLSDWLRARSV